MKLPFYFKIIIAMLILVSPLDVHSKKLERTSTIYVTEVTIKNKDLLDFIKERVFRVVDSLLLPQTPYIYYMIKFEKKPWIKSYDCNVTIGAYDVPRKYSDTGYDESIERGYKHNSYVTFIDGRKILVRSGLNNPYIAITPKRIRVNQKEDIWCYTGIIWNIAMKGDRILAVNLDCDSHPNLESDNSIRMDFYLLPKECIREIRSLRRPKYIRIAPISPPARISLPNIAETPQ